MKLAHLEYISNGKHSTDRPRGLHPGVFKTGTGWPAVADRLCPMLAARPEPTPVVFWCIGGVGAQDELLIEDRPFLEASTHLPTAWADRFLSRNGFASAMGRIMLANKGAPLWAYIGCPTQPHPDEFLLAMVKAGLIHGVIFDAIALSRHPDAAAQFDAYRAAGAMLAYEAMTTYAQRDLWADPRWTCCSSVVTWNKEQTHIANKPPSDSLIVHQQAMAQPVLILDQQTAGPGAAAAIDLPLAAPLTFASNLLATVWQTLPPAPTGDGNP